MLKTIPCNVEPRDKSTANKKDYKYIPKKIFQTWVTNSVTPDMYAAMSSWIDKNPDWEYYLFDDQACRNFIKDNFPKRVLDAYDALIPGAYKADLWRYCVLYVNGGVYADCKLFLCNKLDMLLDPNTKFTSVKDRKGLKTISGGVFNNFICSMPKHPFLKKVIDIVVDNVRTSYFGERSISPTGPLALGKAMNLVLGRREREDFGVGSHKIGNFEFTLWFCPRNPIFKPPSDTSIFTNKKSKCECFIIGYDFYKKENLALARKLGRKLGRKHEYGSCWENCTIYNVALDREKILYPVISQVKKLYKNKNNKQARKLIVERLLTYKQFRPVLFRCFIQYEILVPTLRLLRL